MYNRFIISPLNGEKFRTTKKIGDKELIINTSIENAIDVNRVGVVESLPIDYNGNIKVGDNVVVQHNVFRTYFDGQGLTRESDNHIKDNLFQIEPELIYLIIRGDEIISVENYVFVSPIFEEVKWIGKQEQKQVGILKFDNPILLNKGIRKGDTVVFGMNCEYAFDIFGETLYRMRVKRILAKLN
jgi:hypothetical protein